MQAIGEPLDCIYYNSWNVIIPEGTFLSRLGRDDNFPDMLLQIRGPQAVAEWNRLRVRGADDWAAYPTPCSPQSGAEWNRLRVQGADDWAAYPTPC